MKRRLAVAAVLAVSVALAFTAWGCSVPSTAHDLTVDGRERGYRVYVPPDLPPDRPVPLVFSLHGRGGTGRQTERSLGFDEIADREGFIVVYPDGWERGWNDGRGSDEIPSQRDHVDDVKFIEAVLEKVMKCHRIDEGRVYVTGISNGAFMSHLLAVRCPGRFAAAAPVIGGMAKPVADSYPDGPPVAMLVIQGTEDPLVPYLGGAVSKNRGEVVPTMRAMELWAKRNGSDGSSSETGMSDLDPDDGCVAKRREWGGAEMKAPVVLYTIEGGGHTWPGGPQYLPKFAIGRVCRDFEAEEVIWEFFEKCGRKR